MISYLPKRAAGGRTLSAAELTNPTKATSNQARQRAKGSIRCLDFGSDSSTGQSHAFISPEGYGVRFVT
jgi:hypothetical protein